MGSVVLPHLVTGWHVDQAIMSEEERLVVIRFGRDWGKPMPPFPNSPPPRARTDIAGDHRPRLHAPR